MAIEDDEDDEVDDEEDFVDLLLPLLTRPFRLLLLAVLAPPWLVEFEFTELVDDDEGLIIPFCCCCCCF